MPGIVTRFPISLKWLVESNYIWLVVILAPDWIIDGEVIPRNEKNDSQGKRPELENEELCECWNDSWWKLVVGWVKMMTIKCVFFSQPWCHLGQRSSVLKQSTNLKAMICCPKRKGRERKKIRKVRSFGRRTSALVYRNSPFPLPHRYVLGVPKKVAP